MSVTERISELCESNPELAAHLIELGSLLLMHEHRKEHGNLTMHFHQGRLLKIEQRISWRPGLNPMTGGCGGASISENKGLDTPPQSSARKINSKRNQNLGS